MVAVRVRDVPHLRHERLERLADLRDPVDRERAHRRAVIGRLPRDRLVPPRRPVAHPVELARELPRGLDRLRAAGDEEDAVQVSRRELGDLGGELDCARMRVRPVRVEGQLAHLVERRLAHLLAVAVADVDREEPGERVEVALAVGVPEVAAVAADDDRHVVAAHAREVQPEVVLGRPLQVEPGDRSRLRHVAARSTAVTPRREVRAWLCRVLTVTASPPRV